MIVFEWVRRSLPCVSFRLYPDWISDWNQDSANVSGEHLHAINPARRIPGRNRELATRCGARARSGRDQAALFSRRSTHMAGRNRYRYPSVSYNTFLSIIALNFLPVSFKKKTLIQCCGSGMFIPDPGSEFFHPGSASKNLSILTQKYGF